MRKDATMIPPQTVMKVAHQFQAAIATGEPFDWQALRDQLDAEHAGARGAGEKEWLLALFKTLMDMVERIDVTPGMASAFLSDRRDSYHRMLRREASAGGGCAVRSLDDITLREVKAGRMPEDDPLREAAILGMVALHRTTALEPAALPRASPGGIASRTAVSRNGWHRAWAWLVRRNRRPAGAVRAVH